MSSILDALKKSERQRSLGRDLIFRNAPPDTRPRLTRRALVVLGTLLLVVIAIGMLLFSLRTNDLSESASTVSMPQAAPQDGSPSIATPAPVTTPKLVPALRLETAQDLVDQARAVNREAPALKSPTTRAEPDSPIQSEQAPWLSSLPEDFRGNLPPLEVNIHVYSPLESQRILYINNRPVQQGERIQAGVMVEEIVQDGVVLRFRGQRFKLPRPS